MQAPVSKMAASMLTRWLHTTATCSLRTFRPLVLSSSNNYSSDEYLSKHQYWEQRYRQSSADASFDWFVESPQILDFLLHSIQHSSQGKKQPASCLDLGCGTSSVSRSILANSLVAVRLVLLDFVHEALQFQQQQMNATTAAVPGSCCHFVCADVTCLPFPSGSFHVAMDKGTMDSLLKDRPRARSKATAMMSEVERILTSGGRFVQICDEDPDTRLVYLDSLSHTCCHTSGVRAGAGAGAVCPQPSLDGHCPPASMDKRYVDKLTRDTHSPNTVDKLTRHTHSPNTVDKLTCDGDSPSIDPVSCSLFSSWSFQVVTSRWHQEYFIYWKDKL